MKKWFTIKAKNSSFDVVYETAFPAESISGGIAELKFEMGAWSTFIDSVRVIEVTTNEEYLGYFVRNSAKDNFVWEW